MNSLGHRTAAWLCLVVTVLLVSDLICAQSVVRLKDIVSVRGVRENSLIGFGLVVGLPGTGDSQASIVTRESSVRMLRKLGIIAEGQSLVGQNIAAVLVTADLPTFSRVGEKVNVRVSAIGDASDLSGGTLILSHLKAGDGEVYGVASGPVSHAPEEGDLQTVSVIPEGLTVERAFVPEIGDQGLIVLNLTYPDFTTNQSIVDVINDRFRGVFASSNDLAEVKVKIPDFYDGRIVEFMSEMESLEVQTDSKAIVVINESTGTIVLGGHVHIDPVSISHKGLRVEVPDGAKRGSSILGVEERRVDQLVELLGTLGVETADIIHILKSMKSAGALHARIRII